MLCETNKTHVWSLFSIQQMRHQQQQFYHHHPHQNQQQQQQQQPNSTCGPVTGSQYPGVDMDTCASFPKYKHSILHRYLSDAHHQVWHHQQKPFPSAFIFRWQTFIPPHLLLRLSFPRYWTYLSQICQVVKGRVKGREELKCGNCCQNEKETESEDFKKKIKFYFHF